MIGDGTTSLYAQNPLLAQALRKQQFATMLAGNAMGSEPIKAHSQGANKVAQALLAAMLMNRTDEDITKASEKSEAERTAFSSMMAAALSGQPGGGKVEPPVAANVPSASPSPLSGIVHQLESRGSMAPGIMGDGGRAAGPMQVHPAALADVNRAQGTNIPHGELAANPQVGMQVGEAYLNQMLQQFGGDRAKALAAYNAGPGRVAAAVAQYGENWRQGIPESTRAYLANAEARMGGQGAPAPTAAPDITNRDLQAELDQAKRLQMVAMQWMQSPNPQIRAQAQMAFQMGQQAEQRAVARQGVIEQRQLAEQARQDVRANRQMQTVQMQDPDGKSVGIYELTPQGPGRRLGNAPKQPGETGAFAGTGMDQQAANTLLAIGPKIQNGTATEAERAQYALAYEHVSAGRVMPIPDPTDPTGQRTMLGRVPGAVPPNFPPPDGMAPPNGGGQPAPAAAPGAPGMPAPIPGTQAPTSTPADRSKLKAAETEATSIISSLDEFIKTRKNAGVGERAASLVFPTELNTTFNAAALMAKGEALFNLGVLNGPDLDIIRRTMADPATFGGAMASQTTVEKQIGVIKRLIQTRLDAAREQFGGVKKPEGGAAGSSASASPNAETPYDPADVEAELKRRGLK